MSTIIEIIRSELPKYEGLTEYEKSYGLKHLNEWVNEDGKLDILVSKFAEKSLDIVPFLNRLGLLERYSLVSLITGHSPLH